MNIPTSSIEPFGIVGFPKFYTRYSREDKIRQFVAYSRTMLSYMPRPITKIDYLLLAGSLVGRNDVSDVEIWPNLKGDHTLSFIHDDLPYRKSLS